MIEKGKQKLDFVKSFLEKKENATLLRSFVDSHKTYEGNARAWNADFCSQVLKIDPAPSSDQAQEYVSALQLHLRDKSSFAESNSYNRIDGLMGAYTLQALVISQGWPDRIAVSDSLPNKADYQKALDSLVSPVSQPAPESAPVQTPASAEVKMEKPLVEIPKTLDPFADRLLGSALKKAHDAFEDRNDVYSEIFVALNHQPYPSLEDLKSVYVDDVQELPADNAVRLRFEAFMKLHESYIPALDRWNAERISPFFTPAEISAKSLQIRALYDQWKAARKDLIDIAMQDRNANKTLDTSLKSSLMQGLYPLILSYNLPKDIPLEKLFVLNPNWPTFLDFTPFYERVKQNKVPYALHANQKAMNDFFAKHFPQLSPTSAFTQETLKSAANREDLAVLFKDKTPAETFQALESLFFLRNAHLLDGAIKKYRDDFLKNLPTENKPEVLNVASN
jgi:hypothetical protein